MSDLAQAKEAARKAAFAARKAAHAAGGDADANGHLLALFRPHAGKVIAGYLPIRTELDPRPAMATLAATSPVVVPVIPGPECPLLFRRWRPGCALEKGPFGVPVPADGEDLDPEVLIVPLLAFDQSGYRLGYGGGFYDRTLERLRAARPVLAVGFAYAGQRIGAVPVGPTDQPLDALVTEAGPVTFLQTRMP